YLPPLLHSQPILAIETTPSHPVANRYPSLSISRGMGISDTAQTTSTGLRPTQLLTCLKNHRHLVQVSYSSWVCILAKPIFQGPQKNAQRRSPSHATFVVVSFVCSIQSRRIDNIL